MKTKTNGVTATVGKTCIVVGIFILLLGILNFASGKGPLGGGLIVIGIFCAAFGIFSADNRS